ncbi:phosphatase PAP2 family protein [Ilumatobacter sp.]|uniref:phosphatase PAP2 family protein n=1 Tax=Ilumatobacter sp. TaxID=1967498 RepID=UPI003C65FA98
MNQDIAGVEIPPRDHRLYWWKEAAIVGVFYIAYSWIRNRFGSNQIAADGIPEAAFLNAERVIGLEKLLGLFHEESIQELFLSQTWFIQFWNVYYGTAHFFVTLGVFVLLFYKRSDVFPQWRNTLAAMTALAILGFAFFPLMPPRLLDQPCPTADNVEFGGGCIPSEYRDGKDKTFTGDNGFGFVDTLSVYGGPWRFDSEEVAAISNQYAAMPSLHIGWSTWCALAVWPLLRRRWAKIAVLLYPLATLFCIIVTGNHFWLDAIGGLIVFTVGSLIGWGMHRWNQNRLDRRDMLEAIAAQSGRPRRDTRLGSVASGIIEDVSGHDERDDSERHDARDKRSPH